MIAVIFEVKPKATGEDAYLALAAGLRGLLEQQEGLISIERFESLNEEGKLLSLSFWRDEDSVTAWRNVMEHREAQRKGREELFESYRIRVAKVVRDYTDTERENAPAS